MKDEELQKEFRDWMKRLWHLANRAEAFGRKDRADRLRQHYRRMLTKFRESYAGVR